MKHETGKELAIRLAEAVSAKISNREAFAEALKLVDKAQERLAFYRANAKAIGDSIQELSLLAAEYARNTKSALNLSPLVETKSNVWNGATEVDGVSYALTVSRDTIRRIDGGNLTGDFLATLPGKWVRTKAELATSEINRLGVTSEDLAAKGLHRPEKIVWSRKD